jgi:tetratricopeptide (TPR) repeat protein
MQSIMREIQGVFKSFINGTRHRLLIVACAPDDSPLLLKSLDAVEDDPTFPDIFLSFGHSFSDAGSYVGGVLTSLSEQHSQVNDALVKRGDPPLPTIPVETVDASLLPEQRLSKTIQYVRDVVPKGRQVIWIFYPLELTESEQYLHLINHLRTEIEEVPIRGTKLIVRDDPSAILASQLQKEPKVRVYSPELDPDSLMKKMEKQANDPKVPPEEQAQLHMMLAGKDVADGRFDQALARNQELLGYFYYTGQRPHQSIVLNNIGDIHYMQGRYPEAQKSYEQATVVSVEEKSEPLVIYQSINLGNALLMQRKYEEALVYYQSAEQLAEVNKVLHYQLESLRQIGEVKYQLKQPAEAAEAWQKAIDLCEQFQYEIGLQPLLERLRDLYKELGDVERHDQCTKALAAFMTKQQSVN